MNNYFKLGDLTDSDHLRGVRHEAANASQPVQILFIFQLQKIQTQLTYMQIHHSKCRGVYG